MSRLTTEGQKALSRLAGDHWPERSGLSQRRRAAGPSAGWIVAGVVVVGVGVLAWTYLGPDLKRYLKIYNM